MPQSRPLPHAIRDEDPSLFVGQHLERACRETEDARSGLGLASYELSELRLDRPPARVGLEREGVLVDLNEDERLRLAAAPERSRESEATLGVYLMMKTAQIAAHTASLRRRYGFPTLPHFSPPNSILPQPGGVRQPPAAGRRNGGERRRGCGVTRLVGRVGEMTKGPALRRAPGPVGQGRRGGLAGRRKPLVGQRPAARGLFLARLLHDLLLTEDIRVGRIQDLRLIGVLDVASQPDIAGHALKSL